MKGEVQLGLIKLLLLDLDFLFDRAHVEEHCRDSQCWKQASQTAYSHHELIATLI